MECPACHTENTEDSRFCGKCGAPLGRAGSEQPSLTKTLVTPLPVISKDSLIAGKYKIIDEVGAGGMGVVYKAEDLKLKRCVALKFLPPHLMDAPDLKERFLVEAQAAAALSHPNICTIYEVGESEDRPYISMEYVQGETLRDRIRKGPLEPGEAVGLVDQVAAGLSEAHGKDIIHRDIKSANIMVTAKGRAKVMDFGLAKLRGGSSLTKSQTTLGTVAYMSPEQARGESLDQRTDIWSLGVVLYELLAGKLPFQGDHDQTVIYSILHREPEPLTKLRPGLAPELDHIVMQALAKKPADRYKSMEEFREDLAAIAEGLKPLKAKPRPAAIKLAVLPFANLTGDPEQEYFSDGLTQEMITLLGRLHPQSLGVIARTSVMRYKKTDTPIDQIGRELGVDYVLEGSARREGSRVRVSADLIQVRDQTQLWGDAFEREMAGILALQNDVAGRVAEALAIKLLPGERTQLARVRPVDPEAYDACLRGMQLWCRLTPADLDSAQQYFDLALQKDPKYAAAHAGIALVWIGRQQLGMTPPSEAAPKAREAAQRAIVLDDSIAETHYVLALLKAWTDWDWAGAESEFRRTIEINPGFPDVRIYYAHLLANLGRMPEAIEQGERAVRLDPYNALFHGLFGVVLTMAGRSDEAIAQARLGQKMNPNEIFSAQVLWIEYEKKKMDREAAGFVRLIFRLAYNFDIAEALDQGFASGGFREAMRRGADALEAFAQKNFVLPFDIAQICAYAGDNGRTLTWLEKGYEIHDPSMPYLGQWPMLDPLHSEPRFQALLKKMNLPGGKGEK